MKMNSVEKAFFMGVWFHYLITRKSGFITALSREVFRESERARIEFERVVDPYNRTVE